MQVLKDIDPKSVGTLERILQVFIRVRWPNTWIQNTRSSKEARSDYHMFSTSAMFEKLLKVVTIARKQDAGVFRTVGNQDNEIQLATHLELVRINFEEIVTSLSPTSSLRGIFQKYYGQHWFKCAHTGCVYFYQGFPSPSDRDQHTSKHTRAFLCTFIGCHAAITGCKTANELAKHVSEFHPTSQDGTHTFPSCKTISIDSAMREGKLEDLEIILHAPDFDNSQITRWHLRRVARLGHDAMLLRLLEIRDCNRKEYIFLIHFAIQGKNESTTLMLLARKEEYIQLETGARTLHKLLSLAVSHGLEGVVKLLLEKRRYPTEEKAGRPDLLCLAAENGHAVVVQQILESNQPGLRLDQSNPISRAARNGHETIVQVLLQYPDCDATDNGDTCWLGVAQLFNGALKGDNDLVRQLLARNDVPPDCKSRTGHTPLILASQKGHTTIVKLLLEHKDVRPNTRTRTGKTTALQYAVRRGHESVVKLLLSQEDIDTQSRSEFGCWEVDLREQALRKGYHSIAALLSEHASSHPQSVSRQSEDDIDLKELDDQTERITAIEDSDSDDPGHYKPILL